jgi:hypothetical protein
MSDVKLHGISFLKLKRFGFFKIFKNIFEIFSQLSPLSRDCQATKPSKSWRKTHFVSETALHDILVELRFSKFSKNVFKISDT